MTFEITFCPFIAVRSHLPLGQTVLLFDVKCTRKIYFSAKNAIYDYNKHTTLPPLYVIYIMSLYIDVNNISNACIYVHWNTIIPTQVGDKPVLEIIQTYNKQKRLIKVCCILTFDRSIFILSLRFPPSPWSKRLTFRC